MDIHRCRFVPFPTSAINAVAFSRSSLLSSKHRKNIPLRLAVGRANGDIEIWNPLNGLWHQELIIHGGKDRSIEDLVWVNEPDEEVGNGKTIPGKSRLFSIGYTTTVTEWDLEKATAKRHASGQHGDIWSLGAQPPLPTEKAGTSKQSQKLVAGTIDGCLVLYSVDDDDLQLQRIIVKSSSKKTKMVSITFQSHQVAIVGCSDSSIRVYNLRNGAILRKMTLGSDLVGGSKEIIVWSVKCLRNGDIVSGDSTGQVCIWDGKTYTQAQRIQSHEQDVLSLATSSDGSKIISGGMDRRTVLYRPMVGSPSRWTKVSHRRYHEHDVKAMASFEGNGMSVVVSGGSDAAPVVIPLQEAGRENHRTLSYLPQNPPLQGAAKARLLVSWWDRELHIWKLRRPMRELLDGADPESTVDKNRKLLGRILVKGEANITSASISQDGTLLIVSTVAEVKAFRLDITHSRHADELKVTKIKVMASDWGKGATKVLVSPDGLWICVVQDGTKVSMTKVVSSGADGDSGQVIHQRSFRLNRIERKVSKQAQLGGLGTYDRVITQVAFSPDSKMLAVADLAGYIDTWILATSDNTHPHEEDASSSSSSSEESDDNQDENTETHRWMTNPRARLLPRLPGAPAILSFSDGYPGSPHWSGHPQNNDYTLLAITAGMHVVTFHPLRGSLTDWSRRNPSSGLPEPLRTTRDIAKGVLWQGPRAWIYGVSVLFMLDMSVDHFETDKAVEDAGTQSGQGKKRKRGGHSGRDTGAGGRMERGALGPTKVKMAKGAEEPSQWVDIEMEDVEDASRGAVSGEGDDDDDDDDNSNDGGELQLLREEQAAIQERQEAQRPLRRSWHTYKYRPIFGIVPLESQGETNGIGVSGDGAHQQALEVALVERPIWDVELPPRYFGEDEYER